MTDGTSTEDEPGGVEGGFWSDFVDQVLLQLDRKLLTLAILGIVFGSLVGIAMVAPVSLIRSMRDSYPIETLFQALVGAIITGVTLVVTITQLLVSQELGPVGDQRERMEGAMAFRERVEEAVGTIPSPAEPAAFLAALVDASARQAADLAESVPQTGDSLHEDVEAYVTRIRDDANVASNGLADAEFGTYAVVSAGLRFNYSPLIHQGRSLRAKHEDALSDSAWTALDDLLETLTLFGPAREHVKTLYFQWDLANLSRDILFVSIPALVVAVGSVLYLNDPAAVVGTTLGLPNLTWVVLAAATVSVAPFALLLAYIIRIATVTKRTLAIGPFVLTGSAPDDLPGDQSED